MASPQIDKPNLYDALKNSQPIAFMSSLSFVIAALVIRSDSEQTAIYNASVNAAILFLIAFVISLVRQIPNIKLRNPDPESLNFLAFSTYFFLALGIIYWMVVAYEFSKQLPSIEAVFLSWTSVFIGFAMLYAAIKTRRKEDERRSIVMAARISYGALGIASLVVTARLYLPAIGWNGLDVIPSPVLTIMVLAAGIALVTTSIIRIVESKRGSTSKRSG